MIGLGRAAFKESVVEAVRGSGRLEEYVLILPLLPLCYLYCNCIDQLRPVISMAPRAERVDLVHVPKVVIQSVNAEQNGAPVRCSTQRLLLETQAALAISTSHSSHERDFTAELLNSRIDLLSHRVAGQDLCGLGIHHRALEGCELGQVPGIRRRDHLMQRTGSTVQ